MKPPPTIDKPSYDHCSLEVIKVCLDFERKKQVKVVSMTLNVGLNVAENGQIYTKREFKPTIPHKYINFLDNSNAAIPRKYIKLSTSNAAI